MALLESKPTEELKHPPRPGAGDRCTGGDEIYPKVLVRDAVADRDGRACHQRGSVTTPSVSTNHSRIRRSPHVFAPQILTDLKANACQREEDGLCFSTAHLHFMREKTSENNQSIEHQRSHLAGSWILTRGVEQPPGDRRFRSAVGKTGESHVAALVDDDVLRHFVDAGWNCRHKKQQARVRSAGGNTQSRLGAAH